MSCAWADTSRYIHCYVAKRLPDDRSIIDKPPILACAYIISVLCSVYELRYFNIADNEGEDEE